MEPVHGPVGRRRDPVKSRITVTDSGATMHAAAYGVGVAFVGLVAAATVEFLLGEQLADGLPIIGVPPARAGDGTGVELGVSGIVTAWRVRYKAG